MELDLPCVRDIVCATYNSLLIVRVCVVVVVVLPAKLNKFTDGYTNTSRRRHTSVVCEIKKICACSVNML